MLEMVSLNVTHCIWVLMPQWNSSITQFLHWLSLWASFKWNPSIAHPGWQPCKKLGRVKSVSLVTSSPFSFVSRSTSSFLCWVFYQAKKKTFHWKKRQTVVKKNIILHLSNSPKYCQQVHILLPQLDLLPNTNWRTSQQSPGQTTVSQ